MLMISQQDNQSESIYIMYMFCCCCFCEKNDMTFQAVVIRGPHAHIKQCRVEEYYFLTGYFKEKISMSSTIYTLVSNQNGHD